VLWPILLAAAALLLILPQTQDYVTHLVEGFMLEDLATQMRLGEYKDAFILIGRHPWLGVGFAGSPDIDTYIGVANVYLLIAEQMGLIGLFSFLVVIGVLFVNFWRTHSRASVLTVTMDESVESLWWGLHAGIAGALVGGVFDHYFFNLDFHHSVTLFWLVVGLAAAATALVHRQVEQQQAAEDHDQSESDSSTSDVNPNTSKTRSGCP
jgi:O-antigen ligase